MLFPNQTVEFKANKMHTASRHILNCLLYRAVVNGTFMKMFNIYRNLILIPFSLFSLEVVYVSVGANEELQCIATLGLW